MVVLSNSKVPGSWIWGEHTIPQASSYCYLGIDFVSDGGWDTHVKRVISNGRKKVNQLHSIISNRNINLTAPRLLLLSVCRPSIEYGSEVCKCNKSQASALESILLGGAKKILGCSSKTCNETVRGDIGLETLKSCRDKAKLKWWYKLASMSVRQYPRQLFDQEWKEKPRRGRQRKPWNKYVDKLFDVLGLPKGELLDDIRKGQCPLSLFLSNVNDYVSNRENKEYVEGLNTKVKLGLYKAFKPVGSKRSGRVLFLIKWTL